MLNKKFSADQLALVKLAYPSFSNIEIAEYMGCTVSRLEKIATTYGLRKIKHDCAGKGFRPLDIRDEEFGMLRAIRNTMKKEKKNYIWYCECKCGGTRNVRASLLRCGKVTHCGCQDYRKFGVDHHRRTGAGDIGGTLWSKIKSHARERGIPFDVCVEYAWSLFQKQGGLCALSGLPLAFPRAFKNYSSVACTASLDRIDSSKAYTEDNVQWLHKDINIMKNKHDQNHFISLCKAVAASNP